MDVDYPFAAGSARLQLLYRLPTAPLPRRLLIVGPAGADSIGDAWPGAVTRLDRTALALALQQGEGRFDAVALPWAQELSAAAGSGRASRDALLRSVHRLLVPGGVVVGHLDNIDCVQHLSRSSRLSGLLDAVRSVFSTGAGASKHCVRGLLGSGFTGAECYYVQPNIESPMGLIPCAPVAARAQFLRSLRGSRGHYGRAAYALRWLVAFSGCAGMLQPELFFWAKKAC